MFDQTDRYFSFTGDIAGLHGRVEVDFFRYDRVLDTVTTQEKWYKVCPGQVPSGCAVYSAVTYPGYNMIRMNQHPNANYLTVIWQDSCNDSTWTQGCGIEAFNPTYNFLGPIFTSFEHLDCGFDVNGVSVCSQISLTNSNSVPGAWSIGVSDLTKLSTTGPTSKYVYLPCQFARLVGSGSIPGGCNGTSLSAKTNGTHISMTGTWGPVPGWAEVSTMQMAGVTGAYPIDNPPLVSLGTAVTTTGSHMVTPSSMANIADGTQQLIDWNTASAETLNVTAVTGSTFTATFTQTHLSTAQLGNLSVGDTGPFSMENIAVEIDTTQPATTQTHFYRIGRAMSIRAGNYNAEPHTSVNRDWSAILWGSNWNVDADLEYGFWTSLSGSSPTYNVTASTSGTGSGTNTGSNCPVSGATAGTLVTCNATATGYSTFTSWGATTCGGTPSGTTYTYTVAANCNIDAQFTSGMAAITSLFGVL
jgi:hypothetical protein